MRIEWGRNIELNVMENGGMPEAGRDAPEPVDSVIL